jgi:hypothetical protein
MPLNAIKNYVKEELPGIYEAGKFIRDRAEDFNENREQVFEGVQQQQDGKDSTQINEEVRPIGSEAVLNGEPVFWSGQNYEWQSKASFDKLMAEGQFRMGEIAAQRIGNSITEAIPQEVKDFATEKITDATTAAVDWYDSQSYENKRRYINPTLNIANGVVTLADQGLEFISEKTNTSRFITDELAMAALTAGGSAAVRRATPAIKQGAKTAIKAIDKYGPTIDDIFPPTPPAALATAGAAPNIQLNVSGGKANLDLAPQVMNLTIKNSDNLARGAAQGWAEGPEFGEEMTKWRNRRMELREQMRNPSGLTADRRRKNKSKSLITAYNDVSTAATRLPDNPVAYDKTPFKKFSDLELRNMEQHHLFPKQESYQFVERMLELGDEDDVLNLMIFAEEMDASMGGRLANMLNMERQPHTLVHNSRSAIEDGRQLKSLEMKNLVENAKSSDELMELFKTYIDTNIRPSKDEAFALNNLYEIAKKQGKHEEMYQALKNKGR